MVLFTPSSKVSCSGVERIIPLCVSLWYSVSTFSTFPFTTTLLMRLNCHEPPMRSGEPPAVGC